MSNRDPVTGRYRAKKPLPIGTILASLVGLAAIAFWATIVVMQV